MSDLAPDDLTKLRTLDPPAIEAALKARFKQDKIYTNINSLLVALNPYKQIPGIYAHEKLVAYTQYASLPPEPHVYSIAADAYRGLLESHSQSIIISGESGAGECALVRVRAAPRAGAPRTAF
jgi:myosin heavy subunit